MKPIDWQTIATKHGFKTLEELFLHYITTLRMTDRQLADELLLSTTAVQIKRHSLQLPASRTSHPTNPLAGLDTSTMTVKEISQAVGLSKPVVNYHLHCNNLPFKRVRNWRNND